MGTGEIGKWAWRIGLGLAVIGGILSAFDTDLGAIGDIAIALAFVGGVLHFGSGDNTGFYIATIALVTFWAAAGGLYVDVLGDLVAGILGGAAGVASAAVAGSLVMTVYDWLMPSS